MFKLLNLILLLINLATNTLYLLWLCNDIFCCSNENKFLMKFLWHTSNFYSLMSKSCYISIDLIHLKFWINSINSIVPTVTFFYFKLCLCHVSQYVSYIDQTVFRYVSYRLYLIDTQPYQPTNHRTCVRPDWHATRTGVCNSLGLLVWRP